MLIIPNGIFPLLIRHHTRCQAPSPITDFPRNKQYIFSQYKFGAFVFYSFAYWIQSQTQKRKLVTKLDKSSQSAIAVSLIYRWTLSQDAVVLGKNARHSFGRVRDRIPPPTRAKIIERIGNEKQERPPVNDHWRAERTYPKIRLDIKLVRCE